jgi:hypothetical protein
MGFLKSVALPSLNMETISKKRSATDGPIMDESSAAIQDALTGGRAVSLAVFAAAITKVPPFQTAA